MVVYNVTVSLDERVEKDWLDWMKSEHIPEVMGTGCFRDSKLCRVHGEEEGGVTYAITYTSFSKEDLEHYEAKHASKLQEAHAVRYKGSYAAFRTILTVVEEFKSK